MKRILLGMVLFLLLIPNVKAEEDLAPHSTSAILLEETTGKIIFKKNINERMAPASMTKVSII